MNSYYDDYAAEYIRKDMPPKGIRVEVREIQEYPGTVFLVAYASDMASVPEKRVHEFADWINKTIKHLNSLPLMGRYTFHLEHK